MKITLLSILLHICLIWSVQAQTTVRQTIFEKIYLEPYIGISMIDTRLCSTDYFKEYVSYSDPSLLFGAQLHFQFPSHLSARLGLRYMTFPAATDYINIPPRSIDYIYSSFTFSYYAVSVPLKVGYAFSITNLLSFEPALGLVWRFAGGHNYEQIIHQDGPIRQDPSPRHLADFSSFSIGVEGGGHLYLFPEKRYQPFIGGQYFSGYSIFKYNPTAQGNITDRGFFFTAGLRWSFRPVE